MIRVIALTAVLLFSGAINAWLAYRQSGYRQVMQTTAQALDKTGDAELDSSMITGTLCMNMPVQNMKSCLDYAEQQVKSAQLLHDSAHKLRDAAQ
jgi:hypothetical protein